MRLDAANFFPACGAAFFLLAACGHAQSLPSGHATDFTSESYYEPPHERQVKLKLSGAEASPLPGGLLDVKQLRVETFALDGRPELVVRAPQCNYAPMDGVANSSGRISLRSADGKFRVEGEGFLWQQNNSFLTISNRVRTLIETTPSGGLLL